MNRDFCEDDEKWLVPVISGSDSTKKILKSFYPRERVDNDNSKF